MKILQKAKRLLKSVTTAQLMPVQKAGRPVQSDWNYGNAIKHGYKRSATVYSCVNLIAKSAASVQWKTYRRNRQGTWEEVPDHPLTLLIEKPNPFMSQKDFMERMTHSLYLGGNAIFTKVRGARNAVVELWYLPQDNIKPVPDPRDFIKHYEYNAEGVRRTIDTKDIIHNQFLDPTNLFWGIAPIKAAAEIIDTDNEAIAWNRYSMQNRAISDGAFILDQPLTEDQWKEARKQITEQHTGSENARSFWVLGAGAQWQPLSMSPAEMDFIESRKMNKEEICSIFGVPPVMIGHYENATLANIETGRKIFWLDTIMPYLSDIRNCLNASLAAEYGTDIKLDFDTSTVEAIQENIADKISNARNLWGMGVPFNEINKKLDLGFDEVEGGDTGYLPSNLLPANMLDFQADTAPESTGQAQEGEKGLLNTKTGQKDQSFLESQQDAEMKQREFFWKAFERKRLPYDMAMTRKSAAIFKKMAADISNAFKKGQNIDEAISGFREEWEKLYKLTYKQIFEDIGSTELREILSNAKSFDPRLEMKAEEDDPRSIVNRNVLQWIAETAGSKVTNVLDTTREAIKQTIQETEETYQEEDYRAGVDAVAKAINDKFEDFSRYRSYLIARTEVAGASNAASHTAQKQAQTIIDPTGEKIILKRKWITSRDDRVRDSHKYLDGVIVGLEEQYKLYKKNAEGEWIETSDVINYPADYNQNEPQDTINCRCVTKTILEKA